MDFPNINTDLAAYPLSVTPKTGMGMPDTAYHQYLADTWTLSLEPKLQRHWRNFDTKTPKDKLWKHEWERHGRCATTLEEISNEYLYFEKTLQLREKYPIERFLSEEGITCNRNYAVHKIKGAIERKTGKEPYIVCAENQARFAWLYEIRICFDKEFQVIDCKKAVMMQIQKRMEIQNITYSALISGPHCGNKVYYPPLK